MPKTTSYPVSKHDGSEIFSKRIHTLDAVRGLAASLILVYHYAALSPISAPAALSPALHLIANYFGLGVPLFFALSGLSLYMGFFRSRSEPSFAKNFFIRRFFRIFPLFFFAYLVWTLIFVCSGWYITAAQYIVSLSLLYNLVPGLHESIVAAGWSIGVEWIFYLLFPGLIAVCDSLWKAALMFLLAIPVAIVAVPSLKAAGGSGYPDMAFITSLPFLLVGVLVYFCRGEMIKWKHQNAIKSWIFILMIVLMFVLLGGFLPTRLSNIPGFAKVLWSFPIALLILGAGLLQSQRSLAIPIKLGEWSFSIYLLHPIILKLADSVLKWIGQRSGNPSLLYISGFGLFYGVTCGLAFLTFKYIEYPCMKLGRYLTAPRNPQ